MEPDHAHPDGGIRVPEADQRAGDVGEVELGLMLGRLDQWRIRLFLARHRPQVDPGEAPVDAYGLIPGFVAPGAEHGAPQLADRCVRWQRCRLAGREGQDHGKGGGEFRRGRSHRPVGSHLKEDAVDGNHLPIETGEGAHAKVTVAADLGDGDAAVVATCQQCVDGADLEQLVATGPTRPGSAGQPVMVKPERREETLHCGARPASMVVTRWQRSRPDRVQDPRSGRAGARVP